MDPNEWGDPHEHPDRKPPCNLLGAAPNPDEAKIQITNRPLQGHRNLTLDDRPGRD